MYYSAEEKEKMKSPVPQFKIPYKLRPNHTRYELTERIKEFKKISNLNFTLNNG